MTTHDVGPAGYLVLDPDLADRPPLAHAGSHEQALLAVERLQAQFHDQLDANGEGGAGTVLRLIVVPAPPDGTTGKVLHWFSVNGMRTRPMR